MTPSAYYKSLCNDLLHKFRKRNTVKKKFALALLGLALLATLLVGCSDSGYSSYSSSSYSSSSSSSHYSSYSSSHDSSYGAGGLTDYYDSGYHGDQWLYEDGRYDEHCYSWSYERTHYSIRHGRLIRHISRSGGFDCYTY